MNTYRIYQHKGEHYFDLRDEFGNTIKRMHYEEKDSLIVGIRMYQYALGFLDGWEKARNALPMITVQTAVFTIGEEPS